MLRGNLATRPFYNERLVSLALGLVAVIAIALTVYNVRQLRELSTQRSALAAQITTNERLAADIRHQADAVQRTVDRAHLNALAAETHEANALIDQRTFSWTTLLSVIEKTLPIDVRLIAVAPKIEKDNTLVTMIVVSRRPEALADFVSALEGASGRGAFYDVLKHADTRNDDGTYNATIEAYYLPPTGPATSPASAGSPAGKTGSRP